MTTAAAPRIAAAIARAIAPRKPLTVSQWADAERFLSSKGSAEPGKWRTSRNPPLREPMDCMSARSTVQDVVLMFPIQFGKTEVAVNTLGYTMDHHPGPVMVCLPGEVSMNKWVEQKLNPMLEETPAAMKTLTSVASRDAANRRTFKDFAGGQLYIEHAGSPSRLKSTTVRTLLVDELDEFALNLKGGDDPVAMLEGRTSAFPATQKRLYISTPQVQGVSRIEELWLKSDQRRWHVACPHCQHAQPLEWSGLHWSPDGSQCWYGCRECGACIDEHHKTAMIAAGHWVPENPGSKIRGYTINCLYYPIGLGPRWLTLVEMWRNAQNDSAKLKTFINDRLAEPWEDPAMRSVKHNLIADRVELWPLRKAPSWVLAITVGIDTQDNRLAVQILGWGRGLTCWPLDHVELPGDPAEDDVWVALTELLNRPIEHASGALMRVEAGCIDAAGHRTEAVKNYVRKKLVRRLMPIFGAKANNAPVLSKGTMVDVNFRGVLDKLGIKIHHVGTVGIKHLLYSRLSADTDKQPDARQVRFSDELEPDYFGGLVSEIYNPTKNRFEKRKGAPRNEPLDCFDAETEVLTIAGWKRWPEVTFDDQMATVDLATDLIQYQTPLALIDKPYEGDMVQLKGERIDILVTPGHRMVTLKKRQQTVSPGVRKWTFDVPSEITLAKDLTVHHAIKLNATWQGDGAEMVRVPESIAADGHLIEPPRHIAALDLAEFLGWWVSEGSARESRSKTQGNLRRLVSVSQVKPEGVAAIAALLGRLPWKFHRSGVSFRTSSKQLFEYVAPLGRLQHERRVPQWIKDASPDVIAAFVDAAIGGDGWKQQREAHHRTSRAYATTSRQLADDMQELFIKLGRAATMRVVNPKSWTIEGRTGDKVRPQYHVYERLASRAYLDGGGNGKRGFFGTTARYSGRVYCATVPNGTLILRRGGKTFIAGNCWVYGYAATHHPELRLHRATKADWDAREARLLAAGGKGGSDSRETSHGDTGPQPSDLAPSTRSALDDIVCQFERDPMSHVEPGDVTRWSSARHGTEDERATLAAMLDQLSGPAAPIVSLLAAGLVDRARTLLRLQPKDMPNARPVHRTGRGTRHAGIR